MEHVKAQPVSVDETLARPKIDNCGMSKPTATVFDAGQGLSRYDSRRIHIRKKTQSIVKRLQSFAATL